MSNSTPIGAVAHAFLPPTEGDAELIAAAAAAMADVGGALRVYVFAAQGDAILAVDRAAWLRDRFRGHAGVEVRVVRAAARTTAILADGAPDVLFARPGDGAADAADLGCRLAAIGVAEDVSPGAVLSDPMRHWDRLLAEARPRFLRRVVVTGPRGTGRSAVAAALGAAFETEVAAPAALPTDPIEAAARHDEAARAAAKAARRLLVIDDGWLGAVVEATAIATGGAVRRRDAPASTERLPDLALILDEDLPGCPGAVDGDRPACTEQYVTEAEALGLPYLVLRGGLEERVDAAIEAVHGLLTLRREDAAEAGLRAA